MTYLSRIHKQCLITSILLLFIFMWIFSFTGWLTQNTNNSSKFLTQSIHLITGLLVNHKHAWDADDDRKDETGLWLLDPLLKNITKTVYNSDIFLTNMELKHSLAINRFSNKTWEEYILQHLSNRNDINLRPIAQYKKSQECPYYLTYIIDNYYNLPDILLFSHGHPQEHNRNILKHWSWFIDQVQQDTKNEFFNSSIGYLSANCNIYVKRYIKGRPILDLLGYNRTIDPLANQIENLYLNTYCCAQFIVHRSRILSHPISFWRLALKIVIDINDCSYFEHLWHIFFGESNELDRSKTLSVWYEDAHPMDKDKCKVKIVNEP